MEELFWYFGKLHGMHFIATFEVPFEALKGDPALGRKTPACVDECFMNKWQCGGLFPGLLQEGGL